MFFEGDDEYMKNMIRKCSLLEIIGGILFILGMCMCFHNEWNMLIGILTSIIGFIILLFIIPTYINFYRPMHVSYYATKKIIVIFIIIIVSLLLISFGVSKLLIEDKNTLDIIFGVIMIFVGFVVCILPFPMHLLDKSRFL